MLRAVMRFAVPLPRHRRVYYRSCAGVEAPPPKVSVWSVLGMVGFFVGGVALVINRNAMPENVFVTLDVFMVLVAVGIFVGLCVSNERQKKARRQIPPPPPAPKGGPDEPPAPLSPRMYWSNRR